MLRVACPNCSKSLGLPDNTAGKSVKCPQCQQIFKAPTSSSAKPVAQPAKAAAPNKSSFEPEEATAYTLREDKPTPEQLRKSAQGEEIDAMVVNAQRTKIRNKAWDKVGLPAKFVKRTALTACIVWVCVYLFLLMVIVLANHSMETADPKTGLIESGGLKSLPKYLFVQEIFREVTPQSLRPVAFWGIISGGLVVALAIYGLQLAGAESMKKLENYRLSLFSMIVGTFTLNLFCILGLLALMDKGVQYEFRVSKRRLQGKTGEELYNEGNEEEEEEEEEEEDDDEEEEEEEEEEERPVRRKR